VVVLETGCLRLRSDFGGTLILVWPAGARWDAASNEVVLSDRRRVPLGARIEGGGGYYSAATMAQIMPTTLDAVVQCLPNGIDSSTGDQVVLVAPDRIIAPGAPSAPPRPVLGDLRARCDAVQFDSLDVQAIIATFPPLDAEAAAALQVAAAQPTFEGALEAYDWRIASRTEHQLQLFGQPVGPTTDPTLFANTVLDRVGDTWQTMGIGQCEIAVEADGFGPARLVLDPSVPPDPSASVVKMWYQETACAGGRAPDGRAVIPYLTETSDAASVLVLVEQNSGGATCQSNPWVPLTVTLDEPLGDRTVLDGSILPGRPLTWPPAADDLGIDPACSAAAAPLCTAASEPSP
jgi:hypothetical protein